jgi:hypothetical protein
MPRKVIVGFDNGEIGTFHSGASSDDDAVREVGRSVAMACLGYEPACRDDAFVQGWYRAIAWFAVQCGEKLAGWDRESATAGAAALEKALLQRGENNPDPPATHAAFVVDPFGGPIVAGRMFDAWDKGAKAVSDAMNAAAAAR